MIAKFLVQMMPNGLINKYMRIADLFQEGEGMYQTYQFDIKFKEGVIVDDAKIDTTKENIRKAIIDAGGDCGNIAFIGLND